MRSRIFLGLLMGTIGGAIGWLLQERLVGHEAVKLLDGTCGIRPPTAGELRIFILCVGGSIGLCLGAVDGIVEGSSRKLRDGLLLGLVAGVLFGGVGFQLGNAIFNLLGGTETSAIPNLGGFAKQLIARVAGWTLMGIGLGAGAAISTRSPKRVLHGLIGGLLGGMLGGYIFDSAGHIVLPLQATVSADTCQEVGGLGRFIGFVAIGGLTGFFTGLVEELLKQAWVKVLAGTNEGKEILLTKPMNILGRDERCEVPLFGDDGVGVQHAAIRTDGRRHTLMDAGSPSGTIVNGQRLNLKGEQLLRDGDMIQIGTHRVLFREKATQKRLGQPVDVAPISKSSAASVPSHLCPFCGTQKDPQGNCQCSIGTPVAAQLPVSIMPATLAVPYAVASRLSCIQGTLAGQVFLLAGGNLTVGREPSCSIAILGDSQVSRTHARVSQEGSSWVLYDTGSSNGTFANTIRVTRHELQTGDTIQFGQCVFRVE